MATYSHINCEGNLPLQEHQSFTLLSIFGVIQPRSKGGYWSYLSWHVLLAINKTIRRWLGCTSLMTVTKRRWRAWSLNMELLSLGNSWDTKNNFFVEFWYCWQWSFHFWLTLGFFTLNNLFFSFEIEIASNDHIILFSMQFMISH